jgi:hypothetical protein
MRTNLVLAGMLLAAASASAQEKPEAGAYRIDFNLRDSRDPAAKTARRYSVLVEQGGRGTLRLGDRIPVASGSFTPAAGGTAAVNTQYNYLDSGVSIDARLRPAGEAGVRLDATIEISGVVPHKHAAGGSSPNPTLAQVRVGFTVPMVPGKPALVASIDDPASQHRFDIEATVSKVN